MGMGDKVQERERERERDDGSNAATFTKAAGLAKANPRTIEAAAGHFKKIIC